MIQKTKKQKKKGGLSDGRYLFENIPYLYFLIILGMLYIATSHAAERKSHKIDVLKRELQEVNWRYLSLKSKVVNETTLSNLLENSAVNHLSIEGAPPKKVKSGAPAKMKP